MIDHTRRSWIVTISQAAVGLGIARNIPADSEEAPPLPPGVYAPSTDHLGHALMSAERFHPIPPGCPTDYLRPRNGPFTPLFFSGSEFQVVRRLTQLLLGEVSEDAGVSQEVAEWIDLQVANGDGVRQAALHLDPLYRSLAVAFYGSAQVQRAENSDPAKICREGLAWIAEAAASRYSGEFLKFGPKQQIDLLDPISDAREDKHVENAGTRFFDLLKSEVVRGFYTSKAGLKELDFKGNAFYARSPGCSRDRT